MRNLIVLFSLIAMSTCLIPIPVMKFGDDFMNGANLGLGNATSYENMFVCSSVFSELLVPEVQLLIEDLFLNWTSAYTVLDGAFIIPGLKNTLPQWEADCRPVSEDYGNYFAQAIQAFQSDPKSFWSTVQANYEANKVQVVSIGLNILSNIESLDGSSAGQNFAAILKILLSNWLQGSQ